MAAIMCQISIRESKMSPVVLVLVAIFLGSISGLQSSVDKWVLDQQLAELEQTSSYDTSDWTTIAQTSVTASMAPISPICDAYIEEYGLAAANFSRCLVQYARPLKVCQQCIQPYLQILRVYDRIQKVTDNSSQTCADKVLNVNSTQVILQIHGFFTDTWSSYSCQNCFGLYTINSIDVPPSNQTLKFFDLTDKFNECLFNISEFGDVPIFSSNMTVNVSACKDCLTHYNNLNQFFSGMEKEFQKMICVDLQASINNTRNMWNHDFNCTKSYSSTMGAKILCCVLACLPVLFYISNKIHGTTVAKIVLKQKRLSTVHQSRRSSSHRVSGRIL